MFWLEDECKTELNSYMSPTSEIRRSIEHAVTEHKYAGKTILYMTYTLPQEVNLISVL